MQIVKNYKEKRKNCGGGKIMSCDRNIRAKEIIIIMKCKIICICKFIINYEANLYIKRFRMCTEGIRGFTPQ